MFLAAAPGRFALLHRVGVRTRGTATNVTSRQPGKVTSGSFQGVTSLQSERGLSSKAYRGLSSSSGNYSGFTAFVLSHTHAKRKGSIVIGSTFRAFAATASENQSSDDNNSQMTPPNTCVIVWFRNDLRLADNYVVQKAESLVASDPSVEVLPVYLFDPRSFAPSKWGSPKTGGHRARFQYQCVENLKSNLKKIGSDLFVQVGHPEDIIAQLALGEGKTTIVLTQVRGLR